METIVRLNEDHTVIAAGELYEVVPGFNDNQMIDDSKQFDDTTQVEEQSVESFLSWFFGIGFEMLDVEVMSFDQFGNVFAREFVEDETISFTREGKMSAKTFEEGEI